VVWKWYGSGKTEENKKPAMVWIPFGRFVIRAFFFMITIVSPWKPEVNLFFVGLLLNTVETLKVARNEKKDLQGYSIKIYMMTKETDPRSDVPNPSSSLPFDRGSLRKKRRIP